MSTRAKNSRINTPRSALAPLSARRADKFLLELVNLPGEGEPGPEEKARWDRLARRFGDLLPTRPEKIPGRPGLSEEEVFWRRLRGWQDDLRNAWIQQTPWQRKVWLLAGLAPYGFSLREPDLFSMVLLRATELAGRMRLCGNSARPPERAKLVLPKVGPGVTEKWRKRLLGMIPKHPPPQCPMPFFLAARKDQKFCSDLCAVVGQREAKWRWWNKPGGGADRRRQKRGAAESGKKLQRKRKGRRRT